MEKYNIAQFGTFDLENYGDLLFPFVLDRSFRERLDIGHIILFSPVGGKMPFSENITVYPIDKFDELQEIFHFHAIVIGGGDLIRLDDNIADKKKYFADYAAVKLWIYPIFLAEKYKIPILWNCPGVPFPFRKEEVTFISEILNRIDYLSVRDDGSKQLLSSCCESDKILVYPDSVIKISSLIEKQSLEKIRINLKYRLNLPDKAYMVFQIGNFANENDAKIYADLLIKIKKKYQLEIVLMPIGYVHQDALNMRKLYNYYPNEFIFVKQKLAPLEMLSIIAGACFFIGSSLHGNITAFSYQIKSIGIDFGNSVKVNGFFSYINRPYAIIKEPEQLIETFYNIWNGPVPNPKDLIQQVETHFSNMVEIITLWDSHLQNINSSILLRFVTHQYDEIYKNIFTINSQTKKQKEDLEKVKNQYEEIILKNKAESEKRLAVLKSDYDNLLIQNKNKINDLKEQTKKQIDLAKKQIDLAKEQIAILTTEKNNIYTQYYTVSNSTCWKMTKPLRVTLDFIKTTMSSHHYTYLLLKGFKYLKNNGFLNTVRKVKEYRTKSLNEEFQKLAFKDSTTNRYFAYHELGEPQKIKGSIAVHLHLYYEDLLPKFFDYINHIPYSFDLYVSCRENANIQKVKGTFSKLNNVQILKVSSVPNKGRDIAPFYVFFRKDLMQHDYILHIHTKKSLYSGIEQSDWREYLLKGVLASPKLVKKIIGLFESDPKVGLLFPETYPQMPMEALTWLANEGEGRIFLNSLGVQFENGFFNYPVGSFFWVRSEALQLLWDRKLTYADFPEEHGQNDGTLAHVLERAISPIVKHQGFKLAINDFQDQIICIGRSWKICRRYFGLTLETVKLWLTRYEVISFDIFDTLITRSVYQPDDIFIMVNEKIYKKYRIKVDFLSLRKKAEQRANEIKHEFCSINDIYEQLPYVSDFTPEQATDIKKIEIEMELSVCIPRKDMLQIFNYLKSHQKKIILVSDMYLTSDIITDILNRCGYFGWDDMWVSCEKGLRKDTGTMWTVFFQEYGKYQTIHVGDNPHSDYQIVSDMGHNSFYIMSPRVAFQMSDIYSELGKYTKKQSYYSVTMGLLINGGLFNSPFNHNKKTGEPEITDLYTLGYSVFAPVLLTFCEWLNINSKSENCLLFLAREGFFLQKLYKVYLQGLGITPNKSVYFLTSRRASSIASLRTRNDVKMILSEYYHGGIINLLRDRFGIEANIPDVEVNMGKDVEQVLAIMDQFLPQLFQQAEIERSAYLSYINNTIPDYQHKKISVVDVGYAGSIQYFLNRLLNVPIDGYYLMLQRNRKPEKIGRKCKALFDLDTQEKMDNSKLFHCQLFLEAVLAAPFGQLKYFCKKEDVVEPIYDEDNKNYLIAEQVQKGILDYCKKFTEAMKVMASAIPFDKDLAEDITFVLTHNECLSDKMIEKIRVHDSYCSDGTLQFNKDTKKWEKIVSKEEAE